MGKMKQVREELEDKAEKLLSAQEVVSKRGASQRDKADLKMIEQDFQAQQQKADRLALRGDKEREAVVVADGLEKKLDEALLDTFPGSDPVSLIEPAPEQAESSAASGSANAHPAKVIDQPVAPELTIQPDLVCQLILLAREYNVKDVEADPDAGSNGSDDRMIGVLEEHDDDPVEAEFGALIESLAEDELVELVALLWLGRGDGTLEEWCDLRDQARQENGQQTAAYLLGQPLLADHLEEALGAFGHSCLEFEKSRL